MSWWWFYESPPAEYLRSIATSADHLSCLATGTPEAPLLLGSTTGEVFLWRGGDQLSTLPDVTEKPITSVAFARESLPGKADESFVLAGVHANQVCGWRLKDLQPDGQGNTIGNFPSPVISVALHPNEPEMVIGLASGQMMIRGIRRPGLYTPGHRIGGVKQLAYSPSGSLLVTAGSDGRLCWYTSRSRKAQVVLGHGTEIGALLFSLDGTMLLSGDWNGNIVLWDTRDRTKLASWKQADAVSGMVWLNDHLVTGSWDGRIRFWSKNRGVVEREIATRKPILAMKLLPGTATLATLSGNSRVDLWDLSPQ